MYETGDRIEYYSGQGRMFMARLNPISGAIGKLMDISNVPVLSLSFEKDSDQRKESRTGSRLTTLDYIKELKGNFEATLESLSKTNLELVLFGKTVTVPAGNFSVEVENGYQEDDLYSLPHPKISNLTIKDSASTPASLTEGVDYLIDEEYGTIQFKDVSAFTQPFTIAGQHGGYSPTVLM